VWTFNEETVLIELRWNLRTSRFDEFDVEGFPNKNGP
jgi:hypothetical protein